MFPRTQIQALALLSALAVSPAIAAPPANPVGYAQSDHYYKKETRPTLYQPLNLLDARELTVWCTRGPDSQEDPVRFGFKGPAVIDEVRVYTGNGTDDDTFQEFSRAKKVSLRSPTKATTFTLADQRGLQAITLNPPLRGEQFTLEIMDQYPAEDPESPVCLTDVVFYSEGRPLNGSYMTSKLKYDKSHAQVLGTWFAGFKGAPERYLSFFFDGTYRMLFDPIDTKGKEHAFTGDYEVWHGQIILTVPGKGKVTGKVDSAKAGGEFDDNPGGRTLTFEGKVPDDLKQAFRDKT